MDCEVCGVGRHALTLGARLPLDHPPSDGDIAPIERIVRGEGEHVRRLVLAAKAAVQQAKAFITGQQDADGSGPAGWVIEGEPRRAAD